jgi:hypothetical protein
MPETRLESSLAVRWPVSRMVPNGYGGQHSTEAPRTIEVGWFFWTGHIVNL